MKRLFCVVSILSLLLTACSNNTANTSSTEAYEHTPFVSSIEQEDCLLCSEQTNSSMSSYWDEDNVGIVNLNTFDVLRIEINRYDDKGDLMICGTGNELRAHTVAVGKAIREHDFDMV